MTQSAPGISAEPIIDADDCARMLGCTAQQVEDLARAGEIPGLKIGRGWRFVRDDLLAYLAAKARAEAEERRTKRQPTPQGVTPIRPPRRRAPPALPSVRPA